MSKLCSVDNAIRCLHFILTLGIYVLLLRTPSELQNAWNVKSAYFFLLTSLMVLSLLVYLLASFADPGYLSLEDSNNHPQSLEGCMESPYYCRMCRHVKPLRAKHCYVCAQCVHKFDHHCPWLGNCVGERNHRYFLLFLILESPLTGWGALIVWNALSFSKAASQLLVWLISILPLILSLVVLCMACVASALLCGYHMYLMLTAQTTWEQSSRPAIPYLKGKVGNPFDEGCAHNVARFLCAWSNWEDVYNRTTSTSDLSTL